MTEENKPKKAVFWYEDELSDAGKAVLDKFHEDKLGSAEFAFAFRSPAERRAGKELAGKASKISRKMRDLGFEADFLIVISKDHWDEMDAGKREALLDHELTHCAVIAKLESEDCTLRIVPHDIEEFHTIVSRHGAWNDNLLEFVENAKQLKLFE